MTDNVTDNQPHTSGGIERKVASTIEKATKVSLWLHDSMSLLKLIGYEMYVDNEGMSKYAQKQVGDQKLGPADFEGTKFGDIYTGLNRKGSQELKEALNSFFVGPEGIVKTLLVDGAIAEITVHNQTQTFGSCDTLYKLIGAELRDVPESETQNIAQFNEMRQALKTGKDSQNNAVNEDAIKEQIAAIYTNRKVGQLEFNGFDYVNVFTDATLAKLKGDRPAAGLLDVLENIRIYTMLTGKQINVEEGEETRTIAETSVESQVFGSFKLGKAEFSEGKVKYQTSEGTEAVAEYKGLTKHLFTTATEDYFNRTFAAYMSKSIERLSAAGTGRDRNGSTATADDKANLAALADVLYDEKGKEKENVAENALYDKLHQLYGISRTPAAGQSVEQLEEYGVWIKLVRDFVHNEAMYRRTVTELNGFDSLLAEFGL